MIIHLDADAFFASVEQAADPRLRRRAVAVGGGRRGVIVSASYEARRRGVRATMPTAQAEKVCPGLVVVPGDFEKYERFSQLMFSFASDHTPLVEICSIDEGYFDVRGNTKYSATEAAERIRRAIRQSLRLGVSEGIASNKLVAAVASKCRKPEAFLEVPPGGEREFLAELACGWLPGVGPGLQQTLRDAGLVRIGQLAELSPDQLALFAGSQAAALHAFARGIDDRPVVPDPPAARSLSAQETFVRDLTDRSIVEAHLRTLADRLLARLRREGKTMRTVEVRIRYNDFEECRRSESLDEPTDLEDEVYPVLRRLLFKAWERRVSLRLVSVKLSGIYEGLVQERLLWPEEGPGRGERRRLAGVVDELRQQFGTGAILRGHDLLLRESPTVEYGGRKPEKKCPAERKSPEIFVPGVRRDWLPLNFRSGYSFLRSLLSPSAIVRLAVERGYRTVGLCDPNLHGAVEFFQAAKEAGIKPVLGAEVAVEGKSLCAYVQNEAGYRNLCALLSKNQIERDFFEAHRGGLIWRDAGHQPVVRCACKGDARLLRILEGMRSLRLAADCAEPVAGEVALPDDAGICPDGVNAADSGAIAEECDFSFVLGRLQLPEFVPPDGASPTEFLRKLVDAGARQRYGNPVPGDIRRRLEQELAVILEVGYEEYFLLTWDLLWQDCAPAGIEWITRGSAADSLVCYCLGISDVCPMRFDLYFKRFLNRDRMAMQKLPDIDLDFPHDAKDRVLDLLFKKYGDRMAIVGGFNTFQGRSAFADIAKALGVGEAQIRKLTRLVPRAGADVVAGAVAESVECREGIFSEEPYRTALRLAHRLDGLPRHPKMHPCGVVIAPRPIRDISPLFSSAKGYPTSHYDMDAVEALGLVKMDILAQGGLAVLRDTREWLQQRGVDVNLKKLEPWDDAEVWRMIAGGESRGVHHIESPAMLNLCRMVGVNNIDDLVAIVSVIRPGAANTQKKAIFARRARGLEKPEFPHPSLERCLRTTYGVVAYEEHILQVCEDFAGLGGGVADRLRRALVKVRRQEFPGLEEAFRVAALAHGRTPVEIDAVWNLLLGFQGYAFCRAHSTAYGVEAYQAAWCKRYHPLEFLCAVLTHGKGFYNRLVYSIECRRLGLNFLPPDVNLSSTVFHPENGAIRVPLTLIKGLGDSVLKCWMQGRPFQSLRDFIVRCRPDVPEIAALIRVGAFDGFGDSRARQFWQSRLLVRETNRSSWDLPLESTGGSMPTDAQLSTEDHLERLKAEQELLGFPVSGHPLDLFPDVNWDSYCPLAALQERIGQRVTVAGLVIEDRLHRQADGKLMKFLTLCDPSGTMDGELFAAAYRRFGVEVVRHPVIEATGVVLANSPGAGCTMRILRLGAPRR
jgi:DNA-directed DNA polymerase III PolC